MHLAGSASQTRDLTYTKILSKSTADSKVLLSSELAERLVRIIASKRAVRASGVAMLMIARSARFAPCGMRADIPRD
jgi:hypothetical protein